jgi:hypothetical protein
VSDLSQFDLSSMTPVQFEQYLPELFATSDGGKVSEDPRLTAFLAANPDCAALVRDLETIAETAKSLFQPDQEPSDTVWSNIANQLQQDADDQDEPIDLSE